METNSKDSPRVFVSYSHDSCEHSDRVLTLANQLRAEGIDCHIDQYETSPSEGWPRWMLNQIQESEFVLVVCTEKYDRRFKGKEEKGKGLGVNWEGAIITQTIYDYESHNTKFIPVLLSADDAEYIPNILRGTTRYTINAETEYHALYRFLTRQPAVVKPQLGQLRPLPALERRQIFPPSGEEQPAQTNLTVDANLVLLTSEGSGISFVRSEKIEVDRSIKLTLIPEDSRDIASLESLQKAGRASIGVAFDFKADLASFKSGKLIQEGEKKRYLLELETAGIDYRGGGLGEMAFIDYSPDQIAAMRARRILLDEKISGWDSDGKMTVDKLNIATLEAFVQGIGTPVRVTQSPLPSLYKIAKKNPSDFLAYARLLSVLWLRLSGVVEYIYRLDLSMKSDSELEVDFEGKRARAYVNVEPTTIKVEGICNLLNEESA